MNTVDVDASEHYEAAGIDDAPSALAVIIDTNPRAWAALAPTVSIDGAIANLLVFINAHLAYNNSNEVVVLAAHPKRAEFLYPPRPEGVISRHNASNDNDVDMTDASAAVAAAAPSTSANKFPQFMQVEGAVMASLKALMSSTRPDDLACSTSQVSGALSLALARIKKSSQAYASASDKPENSNAAPASSRDTSSATTFRGRVFILSVSDSEPSQYVPTINAAHAAAHLHIPVDALALAGQATFLQQAASITDGSFVDVPAGNQHGLLACLMFGFAGDPGGRSGLVEPSNSVVDFRGACFCHGHLVSEGFVCSTCLSIFCEPPADAGCLTCGVKLALGRYGGKPAVIPRRKKKRKRPPVNGANGGSATGTPRA